MRHILLSLAVMGLLLGCAKDSTTDRGSTESAGERIVGGAAGTLAAHDSMFVREAAQGGLAEVKVGQLASQNGQSDAVKRFGQKLVADHSRMNQELKQIASRKGATITESDLGKHQADYDRLNQAKGAQFDSTFKQIAIKSHEEAVRLFENESQRGSDPDLKAFAQKHLPHLREHLNAARQLTEGQITPPPASPK